MSASARTYDAARSALYALVPRGVVLGLEPVRDALRTLGDPQSEIPAVHIAGTNGKGSVAAMVDAGLRAHGARVGLYTSPHLHRFAERVRVQGVACDEAVLGAAIDSVLDAMARGEIPQLTFFEAATVAAWQVFRRASLDIVVLEVGLGGRLDATNVCAPRVTAITRIARDHEAMLGETLGAIAGEKAGILKPGVPCVLGPDLRENEARRAIERCAREVGARLIDAPRARVLSVGDDLRARVAVGLRAGGEIMLALPLAGAHQAGNAAVAMGILEELGVSPEDAARGIAGTVWPARLERVDRVLLDAAHNPDASAVLATAIARLDVPMEDRALVFGASKDKDWRAMLDLLAPLFPAEKRFYCAAALKRAEAPGVFAEHAPGAACASVTEALERARGAVTRDGLVVVCGSIFVVAEARAEVLGIEADPPVAM